MAEWRDSIDQLLYAGEEVLIRVGRGPSEVVVTSHRLLAMTPERDGPNFRAVDRPNVEGVERDATGRWTLVSLGSRALIIGLAALLVGVVVDFERIAGAVPAPGADTVGAGSVLGMIEGVRSALLLAEPVLIAFGGLFALVGAGALAGYWVTRHHEVVVRVAGEDDLRLDADSFTESDLSKIETGLERS